MGQTSKWKRVINPLKEKYYLNKYSDDKVVVGSKEWLIAAEIKYGGLAIKVPRNKVSPQDPRSEEQLRKGGMTGGDRMLHHRYAEKYAEYLQAFVGQSGPLTLCEVGILKGTGLAIWCELFENARVLGMDIDLDHTKNNMPHLNSLGAFKNNQPELYEFDQFQDNIEYLGEILKGDKIQVCIDDGFHSNESILNTIKNFMPHLAEGAVYFVEDNSEVHREIKRIYPDLTVDAQGALTVVTGFKP